MTNQTKPTNRTIKSLASQMFKGYFFEALLILIIIEVIVSVPGRIIDTFFPDVALLNYFADVYTLLIRGPLQFGAAIYFLCNFRNQRVRLNCLMYGFDYFSKAAAIYVFTFILQTFGFVLFIFPGIIMMINYSQAMFILVDDPRKQAFQCMRESKEMMKGHKMELLSFAISYWLPFIISRAPQYILQQLIAPVTLQDFYTDPKVLVVMQNKVFDSPWYILCQLAMILFATYFFMGRAAYYDILSGNLIFSDELPEEDENPEKYVYTEVPRTDSNMDDEKPEETVPDDTDEIQ